MKLQDITTGFQQVDHAQADFLIDFLATVNQAPEVQDCLKEQLHWLDIQPGYHVLDIGCGLGDQALEMAKKVGTSGKVIGTDMSEAMVRTATQRHTASGLPITFKVAQATEQPFPEKYFDRIRTERVLLYVHDLNKAFKEVYRLLKPGGKFLAFDINCDALTIAHPNKSLTRKIITFLSDSFPNGTIGADLPRHFNEAKFSDIRVKPFIYSTPTLDFFQHFYMGTLNTGIEKGKLKEAEVNNWWQELELESKKGIFLASFVGFLVMGTK